MTNDVSAATVREGLLALIHVRTTCQSEWYNGVKLSGFQVFTFTSSQT